MSTFILGMAKLNTEENWMIAREITSKPWHMKYFYALYWSATIMTTIGFGDILPINDQ